MPIEIRELVVRATVSDQKEEGGQSSSSSGKKKPETTVQMAVDQMKEALRKKKER